VFLNPIPSFVCPSSELGSASPDSTTSELPEVKAREQGALHYRGVEGRYERPEDLLKRFDEVRRREQLDATVLEMLQRNYI